MERLLTAGNHKDHDDFSLSGASFGVERHIADTMGAAHWHDHVELNLLLSGRMTYLFNGRREQVEAGRLVMFWAAIPHRSIEVDAGSPLICIYLPLADFLALPIDKHTRQAVMEGRLLAAAAPDAGDIQTATRWVSEWDTGSPAHRQLVADEVKLRVRRLSLDRRGTGPARSSQTSGSAARRDRVAHAEALVELINAHFAEPLSIPQLAALAKLHPSTAAAAFRAVMGISINEYLIRYRLARALERLADSDDAILDIAFACGFGSASRFYDLFKARVGEAPLQFRRRVRKGT